MFARLRNRLVMVNLIVIAALFGILITGTYLVTGSYAKKSAEDIMYGMASDLLAAEPGRPLPPPPPAFSYVKVDAEGHAAERSPFSALNDRACESIARSISRNAPEETRVTNNGSEYLYLQFELKDTGGRLIILHDFTRERMLQNALASALGLIGLLCLLLSMAASFYLANRAMRPVKAAWEQQKAFLANASHELRTPLAIIRTNISVLREELPAMADMEQEWLGNIEEMAERMTRLVDSLLFIARADAGQEGIKSTYFPLGEAVLAAAEPMKSVAAVKGVALEIGTLKAVPFRGDCGQIEQLITILLDNAIRHTSNGGSVRIGMTKSVKNAVVTVQDTGEGIAAEHLPKLFDRFYQADPARSAAGSGLGLAIARVIVENHGGTIEVISAVGSGTTFTVQLPVDATAGAET